jgi:hypothetical protein
MSIDKTTLNRIRITIQHALCSTIHNDINHKSMAEACVDLGIIEKAEDFDTETFDHAPILFEKLWEKIGDSHYKSPLELFEAWGKDEVAIYRLGDELEDFPESALAWEAIFNALSDDEPTSNFLFVGEDFAKLYIDRTVAELNDMQREAFELMRDYIIRKEAGHLGLKMAARLFGRKKDEDEEFTTKKGRKFIRMYDPETGEYLGPLVKSMTHEEAHGRKPESPFEFRMDKEAFDKLKYEHDTDDDYVKVTESSVFDPIEGTLEIKVAKEDADIIDKIFGSISDEEVKRLSDASKNAAEIFCHATDGTYTEFNQYAAEFGSMSPIESLNLPYVVDESIRKVSRISELAEIEINTPLLVYSVYKSRYEPTKYPYGASDVIFDIVDSMLELKKEGMIQ